MEKTKIIRNTNFDLIDIIHRIFHRKIIIFLLLIEITKWNWWLKLKSNMNFFLFQLCDWRKLRWFSSGSRFRVGFFFGIHQIHSSVVFFLHDFLRFFFVEIYFIKQTLINSDKRPTKKYFLLENRHCWKIDIYFFIYN